jgi:hypothetical protein
MLSSIQAASTPRRVPPITAPLEPGTSPIAWLGPVEDEDHILVLGGQGPELMCALLRAGATNVTHLRTHERPEADSASLVIVPRIPSVDWLATVLPSIRRALTSGGRLVLYVGNQPTALTQVRRMLTLHGLSLIHASAMSDGQMISAERPTRRPA